ncbi:hypothetical protein WJX72_002079 [[Myrmecia] bisecta]|uniref:Amino acid transporter n=1 Tax=[Myrmecia] bisecta TaxID=41462 RepID=A0AAW1R5B0_9CHLO
MPVEKGQASAGPDSGQARLLQLGYKQELARSLPWSRNCAITFSIMSVPTAVTGLYIQAYLYGGPVALIWGWLLVCVFTGTVALSMAEISSSFPVSGGLYFWSFQLGKHHGAIACWLTGWLNLLGQAAFVAGNEFSTVQLLSTMLLLGTGTASGGGYVMSRYMQLYIYAFLIISHAVLNTLRLDLLGRAAWVAAWWEIIGLIVICGVLPTVTPVLNHSAFVFTEFETNPSSGISSPVYTFLLGLLTACWTLTGFDATTHMMEETRAADVKGALAMVYAVGASFVLGFAYILVLTLCTKDPALVLDPANATAGLYPVAQIIWDSFQDRFRNGAGALLLLSIPLVCMFFCSWFSITSASRMLYAFSRDGAVPLSGLWQYVHPSTQTPIGAVWGLSTLALLLGLPLLQSYAAFTATTSVAVIGLNIAYGIPIFLRVFVARDSFEPGPFSLGRWSYPCGYVAVAWILVLTVIFVLPTVYPIGKVTLNYAGPAVGALLVCSLGWWALHAHSWFTGPVPNIDNSDAVHVNYIITDPPRSFSNAPSRAGKQWALGRGLTVEVAADSLTELQKQPARSPLSRGSL